MMMFQQELMIFLMIELSIWVIRLRANFIVGWSHFWRLMVAVDYDGVSTRIDDILND